jgi:hypothetical protein
MMIFLEIAIAGLILLLGIGVGLIFEKIFTKNKLK